MKIRRSGVIILLGLLLLIATATLILDRREVVVVGPTESLSEAVAAAPSGAIVRLEPGSHDGPVVISRPLTIEGPGARITAAFDAESVLAVRADGVTVRDIEIGGGTDGISVEHSRGVTLEGLTVRDAELHGILIAGSRAHVTESKVTDLRSRYGQALELFDSPHSVVENSEFVGRQEGIATFLSMGVLIEDNRVSGTTLRALAVNEMSSAVVSGNVVEDVRGAGLYCGDMSHCAFSDNSVEGVAPGNGGKSSAGYGLVVQYHALASSENDRLQGDAGPSATFIESRIVASSPLELGRGWATIAPGAIAAAVGIVVLVLAGLLATPLRKRLLDPDRARSTRPFPREVVAFALLLGLVVQGFHMLEHFIQVFRVHADGVPSRGGIVGPAVDAEWIHFAYNGAVFLFLVTIVVARRRGWRPAGNVAVGDGLLVAAALVQGYHVVEHSVKVAQHVITGAKVNPGLLGQEVNLVWLHFAINLAVYVAFVGACACYLRVRRARSFESVAPA